MFSNKQTAKTPLMNFRHIQTALFLIFFSVTSCSFAQDLMASQAPIDRQLKAVDSVSLQRAIKKELAEGMYDLYPSWTHDHVNAYKDVSKPNSFKIDLTGFSMPTPSRTITSRYGYRASFRRNHYGLDIKVYTGDTIYAAFDGKVRIVSYDRGGYGYYIVMRHPNGLETVYGHLSKQLVSEDDVIRSGEPIGLGGSTGRSTGAHLHFETRFLGEPINPELMFDFPNQDVIADTYTWHSNGNRNNSVSDWRHDGVVGAADDFVSLRTEEDKQVSAERMTSPVLYHKVKKGDSLYSIAKSNNMTVNELCALNGVNKRMKLRPGQILKCRK